MEETLSNTATADAKHGGGGGGPLADFHEDMKGGLPTVNVVGADAGTGAAGTGGAHGLTRKDTDTQSLDEFVDAEG